MRGGDRTRERSALYTAEDGLPLCFFYWVGRSSGEERDGGEEQTQEPEFESG